MILGLTRQQLEEGARLVHATVAPTPQYSWPLLNERAKTEVWVKHENHTPTGAFKVRGGLTLIEHLRRENPKLAGVASATRGNHGQSVAFAGRRHGIRSVIVVPHGNSREKNAAMRAWGAELIEHGRDYDEARVHAHEAVEGAGPATTSVRSTATSSRAWGATRRSSLRPLRTSTRSTCRSAAARGSAA